MKSLIIYCSIHHGNTKKVADVIAETLGADLLRTDEVKETSLEQYDLIGFGSGIFNGKHHAELFQIIEKAHIKDKSAFVFSTSGTGNNKYNKSLIDLLASNGALIKNSFSCKGFDTYGLFKWIGGVSKGHPNSKDIESARDFAKTLLN